MNPDNEKINKYFGLNSVRSELKPSFPDKKRQVSFKVSDKELSKNMFYWDPSIHRFIRVRG